MTTRRLAEGHGDLETLKRLYATFEERLAERRDLLDEWLSAYSPPPPDRDVVYCWSRATTTDSSLSLSTSSSSESPSLMVVDVDDAVRHEEVADVIYPEFLTLAARSRIYSLECTFASIQLHTHTATLSNFHWSRLAEDEIAVLVDSATRPLAARRMHYRADRVSPLTHKATCALRGDLVLRALGVSGGRLTLGKTTREDWSIVLSGGHVLLDETPLTICVARGRDSIRCSHIKHRLLDVARFVTRGDVCLLRGRGKVTLKFGANTCCLVATRGSCLVQMRVVRHGLDVWCNDTVPGHYPLEYLVDSTRLSQLTAFRCMIFDPQCLHSLERCADIRERHAVYHALFDRGTQRADISLGSTTLRFLDGYRCARGESLMNQYGTFVYGLAEEEARAAVTALVVAGGTDEESLVVMRDGVTNRKLCVRRETYSNVHDGSEYYVYGLYRNDASVTKTTRAQVYFYVNLEARLLLFIPVDW